MRLTFFADGSRECPLLCLHDFDVREVAVLRDAACELADGVSVLVRLEDRLPLQTDVHLHLRAGEHDEGIRRGPESFELVLTPLGWQQMDGLLEPFATEETEGYQWLDSSGEIALLLSNDGGW